MQLSFFSFLFSNLSKWDLSLACWSLRSQALMVQFSTLWALLMSIIFELNPKTIFFTSLSLSLLQCHLFLILPFFQVPIICCSIAAFISSRKQNYSDIFNLSSIMSLFRVLQLVLGSWFGVFFNALFALQHHWSSYVACSTRQSKRPVEAVIPLASTANAWCVRGKQGRRTYIVSCWRSEATSRGSIPLWSLWWSPHTQERDMASSLQLSCFKWKKLVSIFIHVTNYKCII